MNLRMKINSFNLKIHAVLLCYMHYFQRFGLRISVFERFNQTCVDLGYLKRFVKFLKHTLRFVT